MRVIDPNRDERKVLLSYIEADDEINISNLLRTWIHNWKLIIVAMLAGGVLMAAYYTYFLTPTYTAKGEIYLTNHVEKNNPLNSLALSRNFTKECRRIMRSRYLAGKVAEELGFHRSVGSVKSMISVDNPPLTNCLMIYVRSKDPIEAREVANAYLDLGSERITDVTQYITPTIIDYADMDSITQTIPSFAVYLILGVIFGGAAAAAFLTLLMITNRTIQTEEEFRKELGITVLSVVPYYSNK